MDSRVVAEHKYEEEVLSGDTRDTVRSLQILRLRNNFNFLKERWLQSQSEEVDFGAAGDATSTDHQESNMDSSSPASSLDEEDNPIPPEHRPKWCKSKDDRQRRKSPPREVEHIMYPSLLEDPVLDTPGIWSSKDRSRLYMYHRNSSQQAHNGEEASMMGELSSQRKPCLETEKRFQGRTMAAQSTVAATFQRNPTTSIQESSMFSAEANIAATFQRNPALPMQGNSLFSAEANVSASFQRNPTSSMHGNSMFCAEGNIATLFQRSHATSFQENSLFGANSGVTSIFQSTPASLTQRSAMLSAEDSLAEALENASFFPRSSTPQINSAHSLEGSSSSSYHGSLASSIHGSSTASLQTSLASSLQGSPTSFNGNSTHSLSNSSPLSFYSQMLNRSRASSPPQVTQRCNDLITVPLYGKSDQFSEELSFPQNVTRTHQSHEMIQRNLSQQVQSASEERPSSVKGRMSLQEMSGVPFTNVSMLDTFRPIQRVASSLDQSFVQHNLTEMMLASSRLERSQSFQDTTTTYQETQPGNGQLAFKCITKELGASAEEIIISPLEETTKKIRRQEKLCMSVSATKLRKDTPQIPQSQDNGFFYTPHDFPELPTRSFHSNHGKMDQHNPQCTGAESSCDNTMAMSIFQQHPAIPNSANIYTPELMMHGHNSDTDVECIVQLNHQNAQFGTQVNDQLDYNRRLNDDMNCKAIDRENSEDDLQPHKRLWDRRMMWIDNTKYLFGPEVKSRLPPNVLPMLNDEVFFYMFYQHCKDLSQVESAERLYLNGWRYHMEMKIWLKKIPPSIPNSESFLQDMPLYYDNLYDVFDPISWKTSQHKMNIDQSCLEGRPFVPVRRTH